jgi:hypothetical protein
LRTSINTQLVGSRAIIFPDLALYKPSTPSTCSHILHLNLASPIIMSSATQNQSTQQKESTPKQSGKEQPTNTKAQQDSRQENTSGLSGRADQHDEYSSSALDLHEQQQEEPPSYVDDGHSYGDVESSLGGGYSDEPSSWGGPDSSSC